MTSSPYEAEEDAVLVRSAKIGDDNAFDELYQRYNLKLCTFVTHMVAIHEDAQNLTQEAFLTAWQYLPTLQNDAKFKCWLYSIANHKALDWIRQRRRVEWTSLEDTIETLECCDSLKGVREAAPDEQVITREITRLALLSVTASYRSCLLLQVDAGFSQAEIAELLGISKKSVSVFVKRGFRQFQEAYQRIETDSKSDIEGRSV